MWFIVSKEYTSQVNLKEPLAFKNVKRFLRKMFIHYYAH